MYIACVVCVGKHRFIPFSLGMVSKTYLLYFVSSLSIFIYNRLIESNILTDILKETMI